MFLYCLVESCGMPYALQFQFYISQLNFKVDNLKNKVFVWSYLENLQTTRIARF